MIFGYARVSSSDQNLDRQVQDLKKKNCDKIYVEKISGKNFNRPQFTEMRNKMRFGDLLIVHDLSRFGRNKEEIMNEWKKLIDDEIDIEVLDMPILNTRQYKDLPGVGKLVSDLVLTLLAWAVEDERKRNRKAQREGIEIAKEKGKYKGQERKYHANATGRNKLIFDEVVRGLKAHESVMDIHRKTGLSRNTIYKIKYEINNNVEM